MAPRQLRLELNEADTAADKGARSLANLSQNLCFLLLTSTTHIKIKSAIAAWRDLTRLTQHGRVMLANFMIYSRSTALLGASDASPPTLQ
eukprot:scaffold4920_cov129-Isochrysis_galbana.AAC.5